MGRWISRVKRKNNDEKIKSDKKIIEINAVSELSDQDQKAKRAGFMVGIPGTLYMRTVSRVSAVYVERVGNEWQARRETHMGERQATSVKNIATGETFDYVLQKTKRYFSYLERKQI